MTKIVFRVSIIILLSSLVSCQKHPGSNQPPDQSTALVFQPCWNIHKIGANSAQQVGFKTIILVNTLDQNNNPVQYGTTIVNTQISSSANPSIPYGTTYTLTVPQAVSYFNVSIFVDMIDCGWPVASYPSTTGGKGHWKAYSPALYFPDDYIVDNTQWSLLYHEPC